LSITTAAVPRSTRKAALVIGRSRARWDETELAATTASVSVGLDALGRPLIAEILNPETDSGTHAQTELHLPDGSQLVLDLAINDVDW
jgi:hypothetical protein